LASWNAASAGETIVLFQSADDTSNMKAFSEDANVGLSDVWNIQNGLIVCRGTPRGYLRTQRNYKNFVLTLQWQRPEGKKPGKGGVLIRMTGKDMIWPKSLEAQLNAGGVGDFWGLGGFHLTGPAERLKSVQHPTLGTLTNVTKLKDVEKPVGAWNEYRIVADGDVVTLFINSQQVNRATGCDIVAGKILLTSEGDEIHFRNVRLQPLAD